VIVLALCLVFVVITELKKCSWWQTVTYTVLKVTSHDCVL